MTPRAIPRIFPAILTFLLVAVATPARAVVPAPNAAFLDAERPRVAAEAARLAGQAGDTEGAYAALRGLLELRQETLQRLNERFPLTSLEGIETQDAYDDVLLRALIPIVAQGVESETTMPPEEDAVYFSVVMGDPPPLGEQPVAFMVLEVMNLGVTTVDKLRSDPAITEASAMALALRLANQLGYVYNEAHIDEAAMEFASAFRQSAVIMRLRCPKDQGTYQIIDNKNKIIGENQFATTYDIKCNVCYDELRLQFPLRYISRLHQISEKQALKQRPAPARPDAGLDP